MASTFSFYLFKTVVLIYLILESLQNFSMWYLCGPPTHRCHLFEEVPLKVSRTQSLTKNPPTPPPGMQIYFVVYE